MYEQQRHIHVDGKKIVSTLLFTLNMWKNLLHGYTLPCSLFSFSSFKAFFSSSNDSAAFTAGMGDVIVFTLVWWHSALNQECWEWGLCWIIMHSAVSSVVSKELAALVLSAGLLDFWQNVLRLHFFSFTAVALGTFQCDLSSGSCQKAEKSAV